ncbi:MAG: hypothetical protein EOP81_14945 [Variovorax sp.]|nr:MAG: hypothetical protein EOP81_14945 [Variovorax sp.]
MRFPIDSAAEPENLTAYFASGDVLRSRSVGEAVLAGRIKIPAPPPRLLADWERETSSRWTLEPGDVETLPLARARMRWPGYRDALAAVSAWTVVSGLHDLLASSDVALMACRGARYHHDAAQYGGAAFCNLFLTPDKGLDVHFPVADRRVRLEQGTVMIFDTAQSHAVVRRGAVGFDAVDFAWPDDCLQVFLTWELSLENAGLRRALDITLDVDPGGASRLEDSQVQVDGVSASVCPASGRWLRADRS